MTTVAVPDIIFPAHFKVISGCIHSTEIKTMTGLTTISFDKKPRKIISFRLVEFMTHKSTECQYVNRFQVDIQLKSIVICLVILRRAHT